MKSNPSYATGTAAKVLLHPGRRAFLLSLLIFIYFFAVYTLFYAGNDAQSMNNRRDPGPLVSDPAGDAWGSGENEEVPKVKPNKFNPRPQPKKPLDIPVNDNKNTETTKDFDDEEDDGGNFIDKIIEEAKNQANDRVMAEIQNQQDQLRDKDPDDALRRDVFRIKGKSSADPEGIAMIKRMMKHSWDSYVKYAWGYDELRPVSKTGRNWYGRHTIGATVIDALDTLWIMGMKEDFNKARDLVLEMSFDLPIDVSFFETTIRVLGGLLAAYDLSSEYRFVLKAREVADRLMPAFNTPTGIPLGMVNLKTGSSRLHSWASGSILAEYGSVQLEFPYLSDVTGESKYRTVSMAVIDKITSLEKPYGGLYPTEISPYDATWRIKDYTVGALADSFYEYLLKCWIASDKDAIKFRKLYDESAEAIKTHLIRRTNNGDLYLGIGTPKGIGDEMEHLACFAGGMFALGAATNPNDNWEEMMYIGGNLTQTCYKMYSSQMLGIGAEKTRITSWTPSVNYYILRPEVIESIFYMWRLTHDPIYRQWAREIANNIERWCRLDAGYAGIQNVMENPPRYNDNQESFFLAETLKYLYLIFTEDDVIPLDQYIFNTESHPLSTEKRRKKITVS